MTKEVLYATGELWGGFFCLVIAVSSAVLWKHDSRSIRAHFLMILCLCAMLLADSVAWYFRGKDGALIILVASNFFSFLFNQLLIDSFLLYVYTEAALKKDILFYAALACNALCLVLITATLGAPLLYYFDSSNLYHRAPGFVVLNVLTLFQLALIFCAVVKNRARFEKTGFVCLLAVIVLPVVAVFIQNFIYGYSLANLATTVAVIIFFLNSLHSHANLVQAQKTTLLDLQTKIALSQIKPHFLYNALNSIYALCSLDVAKGRKAITDLSDYLRENIDSIESAAPVPFRRELSHIKTYLDIEALRFSQHLRIVYDIQADLFLVPSLTIQPLVENAVKHGICKKEGGGTITIASQETKDAFVVRITDDGAGFETSTLCQTQENSARIGLRNVKERLAILCNGTLAIQSTPGKGTSVTVCIPKP